MSYYANITRNDPNPIKRLIHQRRFEDALRLIADQTAPKVIIDFGGGDGEFCKRLALRFPSTRIICFEPTQFLRADAEAALARFPHAEVKSSLSDVPTGIADVVFCMEVFEHLPEQETRQSFDAIDSLLQPEGRAIIGVPVEVFLPAFLKGMFRIVRRYGEVDATVWNVVRASVGAPPRDRPVGEIAEGFPYHFKHMGFDYRKFAQKLRKRFSLKGARGSPLIGLPAWLNNEVYFILEKAAASPNGKPISE